MRVIPVSGPNPPPEGDELLAQSLQAAEDAKAADDAANAAVAAPPSAPPLPLECQPAGAVRWDAQPPASSSSQQQQLEADEAFARALEQQELAALSEEQRERLTHLPARLSDSNLVRALSETLASLSGTSFTKLIPAINTPRPAAAEAVDEGRRRLEQRLQLYCLVERKVKGDGNCMFRALSDQLYRTPRLHAWVRECVVRQLRQHPEKYSPYVMGPSFEAYCADMAKDGTWGDHVSLQAAADFFGVRVGVVASFPSQHLLEIEPAARKSSRVLWLSFWAEIHYNSLYHEDEAPAQLAAEDEGGGSGKLLGSRRLQGVVNALRGGSARGPEEVIFIE